MGLLSKPFKAHIVYYNAILLIVLLSSGGNTNSVMEPRSTRRVSSHEGRNLDSVCGAPPASPTRSTKPGPSLLELSRMYTRKLVTSIMSTSAEDYLEQLAAQLTLPEQAALVAGKSQWHTADIPRLGIPSLKVLCTDNSGKDRMLIYDQGIGWALRGEGRDLRRKCSCCIFAQWCQYGCDLGRRPDV